MRFSVIFIIASIAAYLLGSAARADVLVGVAGPLTGPNAAFGAQLQKGAEQAAADINAAGGINGEQIKIELGDDVSDPKQGISVANKFVADGVKFVIGHFNSGVSIPASEVYAENGILEITPAATNPKFTERGLWNTFRACGRDDQQAIVAATYIASQFKSSKLAIIDDKSDYGKKLADDAANTLNAAGASVAVRESVNVGDRDFSTLIDKMKASGVSIIYWGGLHTEAGLIIRQSADQGLKATLVSADDMVSNEVASIAGDAVEGTLYTFGLDPTINPSNQDLVDKFKASGFDPEAYTLYSYAAMQAIAGAAKAADSVDPETVAKAMKEKGPFRTVLGDISFDEKGDLKVQTYAIYKLTKGRDGKYGPSFVSVPETCASACAAGQCCKKNTCGPC
ncbi:amino acid ABC transporter substrate-binding protein (plasmid) [Rhizobium phaseoli]|nr:amino acid ABC transporter substrate-binding protein [Rhizobium phaseoli]ANL81395.1 amino acid ABC transporter substrate-binding protein [Rhizobium phaseoli]